ncbi:MAG: response regulator transcription factor [Vulcanimicrobiaceae bacterium]
MNEPPLLATAPSPQRILIADDHPLFREALRAVVARVAPAATFAEAASHSELLAYTASGEAYDLIFIDLMMPGGDHFYELAQLRKRMPQTPTIVVSSRNDQPTIRRALACGVSGYIPKSSSAAAMERAIRSVLAGDLYVPGDGSRPAPEAARVAGDPEPLTPRQHAVLEQLRHGRSNRQIAADLGIEEVTVKVHISAILRKLHVKNRLQAVVVARETLGAGD